MIILLTTPLAIPLKMTLFPAIRKNNIPLVGSSDLLTETSPLITSSSSSAAYVESFHDNDDASSDVGILIAEGEGAIRKKRRPKRGDDFKFKKSFS